MADLSILIPEATTNYIENPSFRFDKTGWTAKSSTITRTLDQARFGIASLKVVTTAAIAREGTYYRLNTLSSVISPITASAYIRGTGHVRIRLVDNNASNEWTSKVIVLEEDRWQRATISGWCNASDDIRLYIESYELSPGGLVLTSPQSITFYVDGAQFELKSYVTSYCDGTMPGCRWNGLYDESTSVRSPYTRSGGRWAKISGSEREQEDIYMTVVAGLGMAPIQNNRQSYAMAPGGFLDNIKIEERPISLLFHTKHKSMARTCKQALSLRNLHELRQMLIDIIKPDATGGNEPFWIEYKDGDIPVYMQVHYDGGLEGEWDIRNQWVMDFKLNLIAVSPMFYEDNQDVATIDFKDNKMFNGVAGRIDGEWNNMGGGIFASAVDGVISDIEVGHKGEIFVCGTFSTLYHGATVSSGQDVAYFDGIGWVDFAGSILPVDPATTINDMAIAPNGHVYVTGKFTEIGGVAAVNIARWNGTTWFPLGAGLDDVGLHIEVAPNGDVYVGGKFHTAGAQSCYHVARYDGSSWHKVGAYAGMNDEVYSLTISKDGSTVYVCGIFTDQYSLSASAMLRIAKYNVESDTFSAMGDGFNGAVRDVVISPSNYVYACGDFSLSGIAHMHYIGKWNGSTWEQLGDGLSGGVVYSIDISDNGNIVAVGEFSSASGIAIRRVALWNGSVWSNIDIRLSVNGTPSPVAVKYNGEDIYLGGSYFSDTTISSSYSGITLVTNSGTAEAKPILYIKGPAKFVYLENQTTRKKIWIDLNVLEDEEVFMDFGAGKFYSTIRGDLFFSVLPGSDFHAFTLLPGENKIAAFMRNDTNAVMRMYYIPTHWSVDSTVHGETF